MSKIRLICSQICYPITMGNYMINALKRRNDVEIMVVGPFTGDWIPWNGGVHIGQRYITSPDIPLPQNLIGSKPPFEFIRNQLPWKPDAWIQFDAGFHFGTRPDADIVALVCTDPHVLSDHYKFARRYSDVVFGMQTPYIEPGDIYLPYAFDPMWFYPQDIEKKHDACAIGLQYGHRGQFVSALRSKGLDVFYDIGLVYDEYRVKYNQSRIALSWSSLQDLPCRVWEGFGMRLPVLTNRLPDLDHWFVEGEHYLGFSGLDEGVEKALWALDNYDEASAMAERAYDVVKDDHTWDARMDFLLKKLELV